MGYARRFAIEGKPMITRFNATEAHVTAMETNLIFGFSNQGADAVYVELSPTLALDLIGKIGVELAKRGPKLSE
jgi:hypothetical protein